MKKVLYYLLLAVLIGVFASVSYTHLTLPTRPVV